MDRFLVIQLARLGDLLQSKRLIRTLTGRGETHLCVDRSLAALARCVYPKTVVHALWAHADPADTASETLRANWRTCGELAAMSFTGVYNLNHSGMNRALSSLFDGVSMHGQALLHGQAVRSRWLDLAFRWTIHRRSAPINLVDIWAGLAADPVPPEQVNAPAFPGGRGLGVVLAGREARRSLPPDILAPCIQALCERFNGPKVWFFGGEAERPLVRKLRRILAPSVLEQAHDLTGKTRLEDLPDALSGLDALLTPDTGLMHLAANQAVPVQAMFLSSAWAWETGPYGLGHTVWQANTGCAPCLESAPCVHGEMCRRPFASSLLLNALSGRKPLPADSGLWRLESAVDSFGLSWVVRDGGQDEQSSRRLLQRRLLAEYAGRADIDSLSSAASFSAEHFYQEADWMLPDPLP